MTVWEVATDVELDSSLAAPPREGVERAGSEPDVREELVLELALALHRAGAPAHRLEDAIAGLCHRLGLEARVFSMPTAVTASFGPELAARTVLVRAEPGGLHLGRLVEVHGVVGELLAGALGAKEAVARLRASSSAPRSWSPVATVPAFGLTAAAATALLGGGAAEALASALVATLVGAVVEGFSRVPRLAPLTEIAGAATAALVAGLFARLVLPADPALVTIAAVIVLVPGLTLTTALTELATRHLVSGTARLAGAFATFASLGLGALAGTVALAAWPMPEVVVDPLPGWVGWAMLPIAALSFTVLLQARLRDIGSILLTAAAGLGVATLTAQVLPTPLDAAAGALAVALVSNALARLLDQPAALPLVPGLFLLVPGSVGFRSLVHLLDADLTGGVEHGVSALLTAAALAAGVVVANVAWPPRRAL